MNQLDQLFAEIITEVFCPSVSDLADMLLEEAGDLELTDAAALEIAARVREKALEHVLEELE